MTKDQINYDEIRGYFAEKLEKFGATPRGVDWNSNTAQELRFEQLARVLPQEHPYSLIDYGSGFGSLYDYLTSRHHQVDYYGFDIVEGMVAQGYAVHPDDNKCHFTSKESDLPVVDYAIASGIFNIKLDISHEAWTQYVIQLLERINTLTEKGFSFNMLTSYSDPEYMRADLYYADPCFFFDYCKRHFAKNVAVLHDYGLYDFTILVRKQL